MFTKNLTLMALALGAVAVAGCSRKADQDVGAAVVNVHQALQISDITGMTVSVTGSAMTAPLVVPLTKNGNQFSALISSLPVGIDYVFTASGKGAGSVELYHGSVTNQVIQKNKTANIVINMNQVAAGVGLTNSAPVIDSISASASMVSQNDVVTLNATAHDPDAGQTALLTWGWNSTCGLVGTPVNTVGSDTVPATSQVSWTAPAADGPCTINVTVTDANGVLKNVASVTVNVNASAGTGNARVTALPNTYPVILGLDATPVPLRAGVATTLAVTATDPDGDALGYLWSTPCAGVFGSTVAATTTFTLDMASTATSCAFAVVVNDGTFPNGAAKGSIASSLTLPVSGPTNLVAGAPVFGFDYQSRDTISGGDVVQMAIVANQGCAGGTINLAWASSDAVVLAPTTPAVIGLDPTLFHASAVTYTALAGAQNGSPVTVTVTATCSTNSLTTAHEFTLVPANSFCFGKDDGTNCTDIARASNLCVSAAACSAGICVVSTEVTCSASTVACQVNSCVPSTGLCALTPAPDSTTCSDSLLCTTGDVCAAGACVGTPVVCAPSTNPCMANTCSAATGACVASAMPDTTPCSDGDGCTGDNTTGADTCTAGTCSGAPVTCGAGQVCVSLPSGVGHTCEDNQLACMTPSYAVQVTPPMLGMANGPDGAIWATGNLFSAAPGYDFGNGVPVPTTGSSDAYLIKINPTTGLATAAFGFGDPAGNDQFASGVAVAGNGAPAIIGNFTAELDFAGISVDDGCTAGTNCLTSTSAVDYYAVFDSAGAPVKQHMANMGTGALLSISSNPTQSAFAICGKASALVPAYTAAGSNKGLLTGTNTAGGGMDIVVAKIDAVTGAVLWGRQIGGSGNQSCTAVSLDNNGDVVLTGVYNGALNFGGATTALPTLGTTSTIGVMYVAKLASATGAAISAKSFGATGVNTPKTITVDASSNILVAGAISVNTDFGDGVAITALGLTDAFVAKFNSSLTAQWAKSYGDSVYNQQAYSVASASNGDVYLAGLYAGSMGALGITSSSNSNADAFIAQLSGTDGSALCVKSYGDAAGGQEVGSITVARTAAGALANNVVFSGAFSNTITIGTTTLSTGSPGVAASFVARVIP